MLIPYTLITMLKFKIGKKKMSIGKRKGQTLYYAVQEEHPHTSWESVEKRIVSSTGISRADLRAVIIALTDIIEEEVSEGRSVDLADLGSIKAVGIGKMMDTFKEVTASTIKRAKMIFYFRGRLRDLPKKISYEVIKEEHVPHPKKAGKPGSEDTTPNPSKPGGGGVGI